MYRDGSLSLFICADRSEEKLNSAAALAEKKLLVGKSAFRRLKCGSLYLEAYDNHVKIKMGPETRAITLERVFGQERVRDIESDTQLLLGESTFLLVGDCASMDKIKPLDVSSSIFDAKIRSDGSLQKRLKEIAHSAGVEEGFFAVIKIQEGE